MEQYLLVEVQKSNARNENQTILYSFEIMHEVAENGNLRDNVR
jgi:hypothetical protein